MCLCTVVVKNQGVESTVYSANVFSHGIYPCLYVQWTISTKIYMKVVLVISS